MRLYYGALAGMSSPIRTIPVMIRRGTIGEVRAKRGNTLTEIDVERAG
jgi:hypothetical protein